MVREKALGEDTKSFSTPIQENFPALQDLEKYRQEIECLKTLLGWRKERKILSFSFLACSDSFSTTSLKYV
jgi:hypothetical protein